jgi:site-specific recombinase XerD
LRDGYRSWLIELRGLSELTFQKNWGTADLFLRWLDDRLSEAGLRELTPTDLDAFLAWRMNDLRRATRCGVCHGLRSFLQYLRGAGRLARDLAVCVTAPSRYWNEAIPRAFTPEQVERLLTEARGNRSPVGRRDYAILLLLARYGLRAGEVVRLRLDDIDWRRDRLRIVQSKNGRTSYLPLLAAVGNAILDYLRRGRPRSDERAVFLRSRAPRTPFIRGSSLTTIVGRHVRRCGLKLDGRHGAHAFRHARAVSLLRASVPVEAIGNLLGHRSATSTEVYLKLAEDDLRDVGLEVPEEARP